MYPIYSLRGSKFKSAKEFFENPPLTVEEILEGKQHLKTRKREHEDYMDYAELYADYVVDYEKMNSN